MQGQLRYALAILALCLVPALAGCEESKQANAAPAAEQPPSPVSVITVNAEDLPIVNNLPGRIAPTRIAEVRPRVSGIITKRVFKQGSMVEAGDLLYQIDPAPFQVQVDSAKATLQKAKAVQLQANQEADRQEKLSASKVTSKQSYESAVAQLAQADADVAAAQANLKAAELNLQYSQVKAPISGRIGKAQVTEGALVTANSTDSLATIQQLDPVYADFTQSASELLQLRKAMEAKYAGNVAAQETEVTLNYDDGSPYPQKGKLLFSEASVDSNTGQITLRAEVPNPDGYLLPGMYVRVLIQQGVERDALTVPQQAVQRDASGDASVFVVNKDSIAEARKVETGRVAGSRFVIRDGLKGGDRIVVEGFQKLQPGAKVAAEPWKNGGGDKQATEKQAAFAVGAADAGR